MKRFVVALGVLTILVTLVWSVKAWSTVQMNARTTRLKSDMDNLFVGLQQFKEHVGKWPIGTNSEIVKAMKGNNAKKVIILVGRKNKTNSKGEYVDNWGTPLHFYFSGNSVLIRSAGPNKRFDDSNVIGCDDYYRSG